MRIRAWQLRWLFVLALGLLMLGACSDDDSPDEVGGEAAGTVDEPIDEPLPTVPLPDEDRSVEIETGTVVVHGWDSETSRQLWIIPEDGTDPVEAPIDDLGGVLGASVAPDGQTVAALGWNPDRVEQSSVLLVGTIPGGLEPVFEDTDLTMWCVRWFPSGERVLLTAFLEGEVNPVLLSVDLDGVATPLVVPAGRFECAIPLDDERVVLSYLGEGTEFVGMATVQLADGESELLFAKPGCLVYGGSLSPSGTELVTAASCDLPEDSGVHVIDLVTGAVDQILAGEVAYPSWSPTGEWITFGLFPGPDTTPSTVWAIRRDGAGFRQLTEMGSAQPAWLARAS